MSYPKISGIFPRLLTINVQDGAAVTIEFAAYESLFDDDQEGEYDATNSGAGSISANNGTLNNGEFGTPLITYTPPSSPGTDAIDLLFKVGEILSRVQGTLQVRRWPIDPCPE